MSFFSPANTSEKKQACLQTYGSSFSSEMEKGISYALKIFVFFFPAIEYGIKTI